LHQVRQTAGLLVKLVFIGTLHRELIDTLGHFATDLDGGRILRIGFHAGVTGQLRSQLFDQIIDSQRALAARFQMNHERPVIGTAQVRGRRPAHACHERFHVRIRRHHISDLLLVFHHLVVGGSLRRLGVDLKLIGVLVRNESLGDLDKHVQGSG